MLSIKFRRSFFWFFCAILIVLVYSPTLKSPFLLDDSHTLQSNAFIQSWSGFSSIWSTGRAYSSLPATYGYRPVTTTMNLLLWVVGNGSAVPFHLMKLLLFFLTCFLLAKIWRVLLPWVSSEVIGAGVLLFALNPVHTQVASYIAAIATQWAALFICLSVLGYLQFRKTNARPWHIASLLCALLAILSKEEGVVILALIPLVEIYLRKIEGAPLFQTQRLGAILFYLLPGSIGVGLIVWMFEPTQNLVRTDTSMGSYFMTQWRAYLRYFSMYFYAHDLNGDNLQFGFSTKFLNKEVLVALALNLAFVSAVLLWWRRFPAFTLALFWFYIGVSPASSVVVLSEPVNDHRAFIGYLGFAIFGLLFLNWLRTKNRQMFISAVVAVACAYGVMTYQRGSVWRTNENFWQDNVAKNPSSARAHNNLALEMIHQKKYQPAIELLKRCSELQNTYPACHINHAVALANLGRDAEAEVEFALAAQFDRGVIQSRYNWASFLSARGQFIKAQTLFTEADQLAQGQNLEVRLGLIDVHRQQGNLDLAKKAFHEAVATFGRHPQFLFVARRLGVDY
jgi:protein O-mannosyl-transferase